MSARQAPSESGLPWRAVWALGVTQIVAWGSVFYLIAVLLAPVERELGWSRDALLDAYTLSLLCGGLAAFPVGALIDRYGGRGVMSCGSLASATFLLLLSRAASLPAFYAAWIGLGFAMGATLYEPAFAVITRSFGTQARRAITLLTFAGGFASTVFWPLTQALINALGWRDAVFVLALVNLLVCFPLHAALLPRGAPRDPARPAKPGGPSPALREIVLSRVFLLLAFAFAVHMLAFSALTVHLIPLLQEQGYSADKAVWLAALIGPMQVAGRVAEYTIGKRFPATTIAAVALVELPVAVALLHWARLDWGFVVAFVVLYGSSNGILTIARGVIPADLFGRERYGAINGALAAPVLASRALGPLLASFVWSATGGYGAVIWCLVVAGLIAVASFRLALASAPRRPPRAT